MSSKSKIAESVVRAAAHLFESVSMKIGTTEGVNVLPNGDT